MKATKQQLIDFLDKNVFLPNENNSMATPVILRKIKTTRMRLNRQVSAEKVEQYFWSAMATDNGIDSYSRIHAIGGKTFEDVRFEFKKLCGRN